MWFRKGILGEGNRRVLQNTDHGSLQMQAQGSGETRSCSVCLLTEMMDLVTVLPSPFFFLTSCLENSSLGAFLRENLGGGCG